MKIIRQHYAILINQLKLSKRAGRISCSFNERWHQWEGGQLLWWQFWLADNMGVASQPLTDSKERRHRKTGRTRPPGCRARGKWKKRQENHQVSLRWEIQSLSHQTTCKYRLIISGCFHLFWERRPLNFFLPDHSWFYHSARQTLTGRLRKSFPLTWHYKQSSAISPNTELDKGKQVHIVFGCPNNCYENTKCHFVFVRAEKVVICYC